MLAIEVLSGTERGAERPGDNGETETLQVMLQQAIGLLQ